jgi:hypothetical protein
MTTAQEREGDPWWQALRATYIIPTLLRVGRVSSFHLLAP